MAMLAGSGTEKVNPLERTGIVGSFIRAPDVKAIS
jgi:hypothetical protein